MIYTLDNTEFLFYCLEQCKGIRQMEKYHPEGDVFIHSLQVLHYAFKETHDTDLILAAMLHDIGKAVVVKGHDKEALNMLQEYVSPKTLFLIEHHMRFWDYIEGAMQKLSKCLFLANHPWLPELVQLSRWDNKGRRKNWQPTYDRENIIDRLNKSCEQHFT
ncbi:hypothetical protein LCGC14_1376940 [marine sediment metagenome]|uniref:HD domain-containing protein n=1 Tax=marine sediment metagenome TaxID=412755 RepID=A0A0F9KPS7_9ZZZZ